ncbi:hypothetical protein I7I50_02655 [Histoplasma capsulatum G186AR]|uniref:Uncharacterized protein n=1 Tax=Ajellomyces capsulatus TaxID=5037 RepID=A0A8H7Z894_AJECA|nr:hypothetical protein I7I52_00679 [Histoplasma capsulatum]QSS71706.1 hypothetical protein I7I50_02655 [Histoplasma capsulatum G186AR]
MRGRLAQKSLDSKNTHFLLFWLASWAGDRLLAFFVGSSLTDNSSHFFCLRFYFHVLYFIGLSQSIFFFSPLFLPLLFVHFSSYIFCLSYSPLFIFISIFFIFHGGDFGSPLLPLFVVLDYYPPLFVLFSPSFSLLFTFLLFLF